MGGPPEAPLFKQIGMQPGIGSAAAALRRLAPSNVDVVGGAAAVVAHAVQTSRHSPEVQ
jgi:hypothetical protein